MISIGSKRGRASSRSQLQLAIATLSMVAASSVLPVLDTSYATMPLVAKAQDCREFTARNYLAPLESRSMGHRVPITRRLPVRKADIRIERGADPLLIGGGRVGFAVGNQGIRNQHGLGLEFSLALTRIGRTNRQIGSVRRSKVHIQRLNASGQRVIGFRVGGQPGVYRLRVNASLDTHRPWHARYVEYFRVLRPRYNVNLTVFPDTVAPRSEVKFRVVNLGTVPMRGGRQFSVEKLVDQEWINSPVLTPGGFPFDAITLGAGKMSACQWLNIPEGTDLGSYRIVKVVSPAIRGSRPGTRRVIGQFKVAK